MRPVSSTRYAGALLTAVPELSAVTFVQAEQAGRATFVPLDALMRPAPSPHRR